MDFPSLVRVRQKFDCPVERDVRGAVRRELQKLSLERKILPGQSVALTAGSRGIAHIADIIAETVSFLRSLKAEPFIFPAMGSHGGGTAEGQREVLASYGITEDNVGAPIRASMDVVEIGRHGFDGPVFLDREASTADHIGVIARIKPHTSLAGKIESGLCKMIMIGMGKHTGATAYHRDLVRRPWEPYVRSVAQTMIEKSKLTFGLAIVENSDDETALIESCVPRDIEAVEERLLSLAYQWIPKLPFTDADLLIIDEIGKDVSGAGFDPNVLGCKEDTLKPLPGQPGIRRIFVRRLTEKTHGNATGIGYADFTTDALVKALDYRVTVTNCLTANRPMGAAIPVHFPTDRQAITAAVNSVGLHDPRTATVQHIRDTLRVRELTLSTNYDFKQALTELEVLGPAPLEYDADGNLPPPG